MIMMIMMKMTRGLDNMDVKYSFEDDGKNYEDDDDDDDDDGDYDDADDDDDDDDDNEG